jgi:hypothetical protein
LIVGFILIFYSAFVLSSPDVRFVETFGYLIFGFAIVLFAIAFQIMDNKKMEFIAKNLGRKEFRSKDKDEPEFEKYKFTDTEPEDEKIERVVKKPKREIKPEDLFFEPNKPKRTQPVRKNIPIQKKEPKEVKFDYDDKKENVRKPARKIRKAI